MTFPNFGKVSNISINASATLARIGATWNKSIDVGGFGCVTRKYARCKRTGVTPSRMSGSNSANRSSGPERRGKLRLARSVSWLNTEATSLNVLQSRRRASKRSRSDHSANSSSKSMSSRPGSKRRVFNSTRVDAIRRNSVATSRSSICMRWISSRYASTMRVNETSWMSTSSFKMRCNRRSNGPS